MKRWWREKIALLAIGATFLLATSAGLRAFLPWPDGGGLRTRVLTYLQNQDSFDMIYVGSSRTAHGIDPLIVDPIVSRTLERPFSSFNLGINAAHGFETDHLIRLLLDDPPERLRFVVIEAPDFSAEMEWFGRMVTDRTISWHTPRYTGLALIDLVGSSRPIRSRGIDAALHLRMFARHVTNAGSGADLVASLSGARPPSFQQESATILRARGYSEMGRMSDGTIAPSRQELLDHPNRFRRAKREFESHPRDVELRPVANTTLEAEVAFLEARGLIPIYVMPPLLAPPETYRELERRGTIANFLSYASPARHPELFRLESRWDASHLSRMGAMRWSRELGRDLAAIIVESRPGG
jgi:hypothetical protein